MDDGASSSVGYGASTAQCDAVIVGAGFAGMYLLHRLRQLGLATRVLEAASGVGGTWYWNRYPGARCDVESMQYSYSFSPELQQEWQWSEVFSAQPEILEYANHVADRFDLRRDIEFNTTVVAAQFDETARRWLIETDRGDTIAARFCIMATGCLSSARVPDFEGLSEFAGQTYHTGYWPHEPVSFTGKRVAVIGTGSSAIQAIPVIAEQADHVAVFQRTPNYSIPSRNGPMPADYERSWKEDYVALREKARRSRNGILSNPNDQSALEVNDTEREAVYEARWGSRRDQLHGRLQRPDLQCRGERHLCRVRSQQNSHDGQKSGSCRIARGKRLSHRNQTHLRRYAILRDLQPAQCRTDRYPGQIRSNG